MHISVHKVYTWRTVWTDLPCEMPFSNNKPLRIAFLRSHFSEYVWTQCCTSISFQNDRALRLVTNSMVWVPEGGMLKITNRILKAQAPGVRADDIIYKITHSRPQFGNMFLWCDFICIQRVGVGFAPCHEARLWFRLSELSNASYTSLKDSVLMMESYHTVHPNEHLIITLL